MQCTILFVTLALALSASASPIGRRQAAAETPEGIAALIKTITDQSTVTIPADALAALDTVAAGNALSAAETTALDSCRTAAGDFNTASKADLKSVPGNIVFDANKIALHACGGATGNAADLKQLPNSVGNMNVQLSRLNGAAPPKLTVLSR